ncbi:MAG: glutamine amidotransferase [Metallosphaera sp.]
MCRFVAFYATKSLDPEIISALLKASRNDILSEGSHPHGWGYVIYSYDYSWTKMHYSSAKPMFKDENVSFLYTIRGEKLVGIIHARKTLKKFLMGLFHSHPYYIRVGPYDLFFAHNGSVSRSMFSQPDLPYTDSYMILREISMMSSDPIDSYNLIMQKLKEGSTSLNSSLLIYSEAKGPRLFVYYYFNKNNIKEREDYYKMYRYNNYVFSGTVNSYLGNKGEEVQFDKVIELTA